MIQILKSSLQLVCSTFAFGIPIVLKVAMHESTDNSETFSAHHSPVSTGEETTKFMLEESIQTSTSGPQLTRTACKSLALLSQKDSCVRLNSLNTKTMEILSSMCSQDMKTERFSTLSLIKFQKEQTKCQPNNSITSLSNSQIRRIATSWASTTG